MENLSKWSLTDAEKEELIAALAPHLVLLRTKADISQEELAALIGVSRQTYGAIERKSREMSWSTYLSLVMFYDYNQKTHEMLRTLGAFPHKIIRRFNEGVSPANIDFDLFAREDVKEIFASLDEQAWRSIKNIVILEYTRCTETPVEAVVRAFDGVTFGPAQSYEKKAAQAFRAIKEKQRNEKES